MIKHLIILVFMFLSVIAKSQTGTIVISIDNVEASKGGELSAGVFTDGNFPKIGKEVTGIRAAVTGEKMQITLTNIPAGDYAIAIYHDIDKDHKLKTNWIGMPQEPVGFSNNVRIKFGPPLFKDARIKVESGKILSVKISLHKY